MGRRREISRGRASSQHVRVIPVWRTQLDERQLARVLLLIVLDRARREEEARSQQKNQRHDGGDS